MKHSADAPQSSFRWWRAIVLTLLCVGSALFPGVKPNAVLARWNYWQFYLVVALAVTALGTWVVLLLPEARRRFVGFRLVAVALSLVVVLLGLEAVAWLLPVRAQMENLWYLLPGLGGVPPQMGCHMVAHEAWESFTHPLAAATALCRSNNIELLLVHIPDKFRVFGPRTRFAPQIAAASEQLAGVRPENAMGAVLQEFLRCTKDSIGWIQPMRCKHSRTLVTLFTRFLIPTFRPRGMGSWRI